MSRTSLSLAGVVVVVVTSVAPLRADTWMEVESARANARAGGPVSERDAELLERYGCLSGTRSPVCERKSKGRYVDSYVNGDDRRRKHRSH